MARQFRGRLERVGSLTGGRGFDNALILYRREAIEASESFMSQGSWLRTVALASPGVQADRRHVPSRLPF